MAPNRILLKLSGQWRQRTWENTEWDILMISMHLKSYRLTPRMWHVQLPTPPKVGKGIPAKMTSRWKCHEHHCHLHREDAAKDLGGQYLGQGTDAEGRGSADSNKFGLLYCIRLLIMRDVYKTCGLKKKADSDEFPGCVHLLLWQLGSFDLLFARLRGLALLLNPTRTPCHSRLHLITASTVAGGPLLSTDLRCVPSTKLWVLTSLAATEDESAGRTPKHLVCQDFIAPFSFSKIHPLLVDLAMASPTFIWLMRLAGFQRVRLWSPLSFVSSLRLRFCVSGDFLCWASQFLRFPQLAPTSG